MLKISVAELKNKYILGERDFEKIDLEGTNLQGLDLAGINFTKANLKYANLSCCNLQEACLNESNLSAANLDEADLDKASLIRANLEKANLSNASLNEAKLIEAFLVNEVYLNKTFLIGAYLNGAYLKGAYLNGAYLISAYLSGACLKGAKLNGACLSGSYYDDRTIFDSDFDPKAVGMLKITEVANEVNVAVSELLDVFNHICQCSNRYLGSMATMRYLETSRPKFKWLNNFKIGAGGQLIFAGLAAHQLNTAQKEYLQIWIESFINYCSAIIADFGSIVEQKPTKFSL
jgi:Pentapeptide repeats (8 copies)/Pentapeptide repeats (9 copies)